MKGLEVLLVDDEIEFITTLSERLILRGIQTSMATDGESACLLYTSPSPRDS